MHVKNTNKLVSFTPVEINKETILNRAFFHFLPQYSKLIAAVEKLRLRNDSFLAYHHLGL